MEMGSTFDAKNIALMLKSVWLLVTMIAVVSCHRKTLPEDPAIWKKVDINFHNLDADGLTGPPSSKVAVNYEFCIPANENTWKEISRIDPTAQKQTAGKGRVGCSKEQWLIIGSTHQKQYQRIIYNLASLPYVQKIKTVFWE
jgi:hypothetical protein